MVTVQSGVLARSAAAGGASASVCAGAEGSDGGSAAAGSSSNARTIIDMISAIAVAKALKKSRARSIPEDLEPLDFMTAHLLLEYMPVFGNL